MRLGARKAIKAPLWWDDFFIILALVCLRNSKVYERLRLTSTFRRYWLWDHSVWRCIVGRRPPAFAWEDCQLTLLAVAQHGVGKHAEIAGIASVLSFYKCLFVFEILYPLPIAATKFSILFYYRRVFQVQSFKLPFYVLAALVGCWLLYTVSLISQTEHQSCTSSPVRLGGCGHLHLCAYPCHVEPFRFRSMHQHP